MPQIAMYYYKARIYNQGLGRFMQTDPIGYKDDNNLYAHVGNDPLDKTDSTGNVAGVDDAAEAGIAISAGFVYTVASIGVATGVCIATCESIKDAIGNAASSAWDHIVHNESKAGDAPKGPAGKGPEVNKGKQGKHQPGHANFQPGKSELTHTGHPDPQGLVDRGSRSWHW